MALRRKRRIHLRDVPRLIVGATVQVAALFGGRYARIEGAHLLATDGEGRILVVRTTYLGPGWMLPGGRIERGETPHAAAVRETREETGLAVSVERLLLVDAHRPRDVSFVFSGHAVAGELEPQLGEIAEAGWLTRSEIAEGSPRLHRLLSMLEAADDRTVYIGLSEPRA